MAFALSLDFWVGVAVLVQLVLTGVVVALGQQSHALKRGACLRLRPRLVARASSALLLVVTVANMALIVWRLVEDAESLGNKDELGLTAAALGALWYTDLLMMRPAVRRRRVVAELLAKLPTFRLGAAGQRTPLDEAYAQRELVLRSARWSLFVRARRWCCPPQVYWRGEVACAYQDARAFDGGPGGIVVLYDDTTQDESGADLLTPYFTHKTGLDKQVVADVVWRALDRARPAVIDAWRPGFRDQVIERLGAQKNVRGMLNGELARVVQQHHMADDDEAKQLLWAAFMVEVLKYLEKGTPMKLLPAFSKCPKRVCSALWVADDLLDAMTRFGQDE